MMNDITTSCRISLARIFSFLFVVLILSPFALSQPAISNLDINPISPNENVAGALVKKVTGNIGESFMDNYYKLQGWEKVRSQVGVQGIDGLYVMRDTNGVIRRVLVSESKSGSSFLGQTNNGKQMSHQWIQQKIQELDDARKILYEELQKGVTTPQRAMQIKETLATFPSERDINAIKRFLETPDGYRRRLHHSEVYEGSLKITISDITEKSGEITKSKIDKRSKIENSNDIHDPKEPRTISLRNPPASGDDLLLYNQYFQSMEDEVSRYIDPAEAKIIIKTLKSYYKTGKVSNTSDQYDYLRKEIAANLKKKAANLSNSKVTRFLAKTRLLQFNMSYRVPKNVRATTNAALVAGLFSTVGHTWNVYSGNEGFIEAAGNISKDSMLAGSSMFVSEAIIQRVNGKLVISTVANGAIGIGVATFVFDEANNIYSFAAGDMNSDKFIAETAKSTAKALISGTASYGAILMGASAGGPIVMAVSMGSYLIVDFAFSKYEEINARNAVTIKDVLWQLPLDIQRRATILSLEEVTGETILDPMSANGHESVLDTNSLGNHSTVLSPNSSFGNETVLAP